MKQNEKADDTALQFEEQVEKVKDFFVAFTKKVLSINYITESGSTGDFNLSQLKTLSAFREDRGYSMGELSRKLGVVAPRMTVIIDELEKKGIAERVHDIKDRRVVKVQLTPKGKDQLHRFSNQRRKETEALLRKLNKIEREELLRSMEKVVKILSSI